MFENGLVEMGLRQNSFDNCAYIKVNQNKDLAFETVYVDDLLILGTL